MQRGVGDGGAGQTDRRHHCLGGQNAGPAHLYRDVLHDSGLYLRRVFIGCGPAGKLCGAAKPCPILQPVQLHHGAVDVVRKGGPGLIDLADLLLHLRDGGTLDEGDDPEVQIGEIFQRLGVRLKVPPLDQLHIKDHKVQLALGGDLWIQLPQRACRRIAGIGKGRLAPRLPLCVERVKDRFRHKDLSADNQPVRRMLQLQRDGADGPQVLRHILPCQAAAARGAADQRAVQIFQRHGQTVHLGLDGVADSLTALPQLFVEGLQLLKGEQILQTLQRNLMLHRGKLTDRRAADPLGG